MFYPLPNFVNFTNQVLPLVLMLISMYPQVHHVRCSLGHHPSYTSLSPFRGLFPFFLKYILLSTSFAKSLLTINYLNFCSSKPISIRSSFFKHTFCWISNRLAILSFSTFKTLSYSILVSVNCS